MLSTTSTAFSKHWCPNCGGSPSPQPSPRSRGEGTADARTLSLSLPNTATAQELFNVAALGGKGWDHSGLVRVPEHLARHEVAK